MTTTPPTIFPGSGIFKLKDEVGLPFAVSFQECAKRGLMIDWIGLIEAARKGDWWDYQTYDAIVEGLNDSGVWPELRGEILARIRTYVTLVRHPKMREEEACVATD